MAAELVIFDVLSNDAAVSALVSDRIYPDEAEPNATAPYIVYEMPSMEPFNTTQGYTGLGNWTHVVQCYAATRIACNDLARKVFDAFKDLSPTTVGGQTVSVTTVSGGSDGTDRRTLGSQEPLYWRQVDFDVFVTQ